MYFTLISLTLALAGCARAHEGHEQQQVMSSDVDWATRHMIEEHQIDAYDAASFFHLHDYTSSGEWSADDILTTYGLKDESTKQISQEEKDKAVKAIIDLYDRDNSGTVSLSEFENGDRQGIKLPDFGFGPGHHADDEWEYELHHFSKFHGPDTKLEDLVHPEDIEHFRKHEMMEDQEIRQEQLDHMAIVEANIPLKFRRYG